VLARRPALTSNTCGALGPLHLFTTLADVNGASNRPTSEAAASRS
jgi:hypothetical protein